MSILKYTKTFLTTLPYPFLPRKTQKKIQERHLKSILSYAKNNSEYYADRITEDLSLEKIKPIDKIEFIKNFDNIVTDKTVTLEGAIQDIKNEKQGKQNISEKYSLTMTSGSTGNPTIIIQDKYYQDITSIVGPNRFLKHAFPFITLSESGAFSVESNITNKSIENTKIAKALVREVNIESSTDELIQQLKEAGPGTIVGYTGVLTIIANRIIDSHVAVKEKRIFVTGEQCSDFDKNIIKKGFNCNDVRRLYGCTEGGQIACECKYGRMHLMSDWIKLEPVDKDNNPVGYDTLSDKVLLTNMMNRVQPIIRYEVTDRIILHKGGKCKCGNKDDWMEIEGRSNDNLLFEIDEEIVRIPSINLLISMAEINKNGLEKFKNYQIFAGRRGNIRIVLDYSENVDKKLVNTEVREHLAAFFNNYGLNNMNYQFVEGKPQKTNRGKYKRIILE